MWIIDALFLQSWCYTDYFIDASIDGFYFQEFIHHGGGLVGVVAGYLVVMKGEGQIDAYIMLEHRLRKMYTSMTESASQV